MDITIDMRKVEKLLSSDVTGGQIESETGIGRRSINNYRTKTAKLENMTIETASKLQAMQLKLEAEGMSTLAISGLKTAVGDFNSWQGAARVYFDKSDLTVWTNVYEGPGSFDDYKSEQIVEVNQKATSDIRERDNRVTMYELRNLCESKLEDK